MISEIRLISFSPSALAEAVRLFGATNRDRHFGEIRQAFLQPGEPPVVVAEVSGDGSDATDTIEFTPAETAAMLILLCRHQNIPLPHQAGKSLRQVGGEICLVIANRVYPWRSQEEVAEPRADFENPDGA